MQRLLAALAVAAFGVAFWFAVRPAFESDAGGGRKVASIDDKRGRYGGVGLGSRAKDVRRALGRRAFAGASESFAPLGADFVDVGGPTVVDSSCKPRRSRRRSSRAQLLRYKGVAFLLCRGRVFALMVTDGDARTKRGVGIGDDLKSVRARYSSAKCGDAPAGGNDHYPYCASAIGAPGRGTRLHIWFGEDPIRSVTVSQTPFDGYEH